MRSRVARKVLDNTAANLAGVYPNGLRWSTVRRAALRARGHYMSAIVLALEPDAGGIVAGVSDGR